MGIRRLSARNQSDMSSASSQAASSEPSSSISVWRLQKHADYQRVYKSSKKHFSKQLSYFYLLRSQAGTSITCGDLVGPRVGLTVGKVMGKAVDRNRIKRRMREAVRHRIALLNVPVDVVFHPRRTVIDMEFAALELEIASVFKNVQRVCTRLDGVQVGGAS
jgi:ribonuclease P protein component